MHQGDQTSSSKARGKEREEERSAVFSFPSLPASVTATAVDGDSGADRLAGSVGLGVGLGDGQSLALDFGPRLEEYD